MFSFYHVFPLLIIVMFALTTIAFLKLFKVEKKKNIRVFCIKFHWRWPGAAYNLTWIILGISFFMFLGIVSLCTKFQGYTCPIILCIICAIYMILYFWVRGRKRND